MTQGNKNMAETKTQIAIRCNQKLKDDLMKKAANAGFKTLSEYMLFVAQNAEIKVSVKIK